MAKRRAKTGAATAAISAVSMLAAAAPVDFPLPDGAVLVGSDIRGEDRLAVPTERVGEGGSGLLAVDGFVSVRSWRQPDTRRAPIALIEPMREALEEQGFRPVFDCADDACGGLDFRFDAPILPAPLMRVDVADMALATLTRPGEAGDTYISVLASRVLGAAHLQVSLVEPGGAAPSDPPPAETGAIPAITALEAPSAHADREPEPGPPALGDAGDLYDRLAAAGKVTLATVDFEVGGSGLLPSGTEELDTVAEMLSVHPDLELSVVGHSDTSGDFDANIALSRARARSVVEALVARGVSPERLQAHAVGPLAPATSNRTADGRAQNRRVVLVERAL